VEYTFGPFVLNTKTTRLTRDDVDVHLRPRAFNTLRVLVEHAGEFLHPDTFIAEAWGGTHVSHHTVDVTVSEVRRRLGDYAGWIVHRSKVGYALQVPASDDAVRQGWHLWNQRTRSGCERAIDCFRTAIADTPSDFRAHEGLSTAYLTLGIFGIGRPLDVYPQFLAAHERAVALSGLRPELRCNRGWGLHVFEHQATPAEAELVRTLEEKPSLGSTYVRLAMVYGSLGRFGEALDILNLGRRQDPLLATLAATEVLVRYWQRDYEGAVTLGRRAVELHPYLNVVRVNYGQALQFAGRPQEALAQYHVASIISPDVPWLRALEAACQISLGRHADAAAMLDGLEGLRRSEYVDAYYMAVFREALGQRREALVELHRAVDENSASLYALGVDPKFDGLRGEAQFLRAQRRIVALPDGVATAPSQVAGGATRQGRSPRARPSHLT
jgi:DNA-binding winged helix-turn-helix (wHTH) protein